MNIKNIHNGNHTPFFQVFFEDCLVTFTIADGYNQNGDYVIDMDSFRLTKLDGSRTNKEGTSKVFKKILDRIKKEKIILKKLNPFED